MCVCTAKNFIAHGNFLSPMSGQLFINITNTDTPLIVTIFQDSTIYSRECRDKFLADKMPYILPYNESELVKQSLWELFVHQQTIKEFRANFIERAKALIKLRETHFLSNAIRFSNGTGLPTYISGWILSAQIVQSQRPKSENVLVINVCERGNTSSQTSVSGSSVRVCHLTPDYITTIWILPFGDNRSFKYEADVFFVHPWNKYWETMIQAMDEVEINITDSDEGEVVQVHTFSLPMKFDLSFVKG